GKLAPFDVTPFRISAAAKIPLTMAYGFKRDKENYAFFANPARVYEYSGTRAREIELRAWVQEYAAHLELHLSKYPDQWFNFFPFWSSVPIPPSRSNDSPATKVSNHLLEELERRPRQAHRVESGKVPISGQ
ncbi:MAG: hypothetical protein V4692_12070, partial [Bdellovibrionota bacterium]